MKDYKSIEGLQDNIRVEVKATYDRGYKQGYEDGKKVQAKKGVLEVAGDIGELMQKEYQRGLDEAWDTVRKIYDIQNVRMIQNIFGAEANYAIHNYSASEVMAKIREYEEKQKAEDIKVGDEV